jgi:hypothetical protein
LTERDTVKLTKSMHRPPDKNENMLGAKQLTTFIGMVLIASALAPTLAIATTQVSGTVLSVSIYTGAIGTTGAEVVISPALPNGTEGCTYTPANTIFIDFSSTVQPDGKSLYTTVLAALLAAKQMTFGVSGCAINGAVPVVYRVDVVPNCCSVNERTQLCHFDEVLASLSRRGKGNGCT